MVSSNAFQTLSLWCASRKSFKQCKNSKWRFSFKSLPSARASHASQHAKPVAEHVTKAILSIRAKAKHDLRYRLRGRFVFSCTRQKSNGGSKLILSTSIQDSSSIQPPSRRPLPPQAGPDTQRVLSVVAVTSSRLRCRTWCPSASSAPWRRRRSRVACHHFHQ